MKCIYLECNVSVFRRVSIYQIYKNRKFILKCNNISQYYCFYCIFDQRNAALVQHKRLLLITLYFYLKKFISTSILDFWTLLHVSSHKTGLILIIFIFTILQYINSRYSIYCTFPCIPCIHINIYYMFNYV